MNNMEITLALKNGYLPDKYGKFATEKEENQPIVSFPFDVSNIPTDAKVLAWTLIDDDAISVCGFSWIHWTGANLPVNGTTLSVPEDFSRQANAPILQGKTSQASPFVGQKNMRLRQTYTGPTPPDTAHCYTLSVYALSENLALENGFWLNELLHQMDKKIMARATATFLSRAD